MIIIKIWGGLGNQLFQYSFGKYLSVKLNTEVKYDIQTSNKLSNFIQRDLSISFFNINMEVASDVEIDEQKKFRSISLARLERKIAQNFPYLVKNHIVESNKPKSFGTLQFRDNCYYEGYWQSYKYLTDVEAILRQEFTIKLPPRQVIVNTINEMESEQSVSIHVRRGDYLHNKRFTTCKMDYYKKAMAHFEKMTSNTKFYIFSDDIFWCMENFIGAQYVFIKDNKNYEDMCLMSKCKHNIIANSTFSWWGAWLNSNPQKIIITPKEWHRRHDEKYNDLLPENWIKIE